MEQTTMVYLIAGCGVLGLLYAWVRSSWINKQDAGNDRMRRDRRPYS